MPVLERPVLWAPLTGLGWTACWIMGLMPIGHDLAGIVHDQTEQVITVLPDLSIHHEQTETIIASELGAPLPLRFTWPKNPPVADSRVLRAELKATGSTHNLLPDLQVIQGTASADAPGVSGGEVWSLEALLPAGSSTLTVVSHKNSGNVLQSPTVDAIWNAKGTVSAQSAIFSGSTTLNAPDDVRVAPLTTGVSVQKRGASFEVILFPAGPLKNIPCALPELNRMPQAVFSGWKDWKDVAAFITPIAGDTDTSMSDPRIRSAAEEAVGSKTGLEAIEALYGFVTSRTRYQEIMISPKAGIAPQPALETLLTRKGDCKAMVHLLSALCRSVGEECQMAAVNWGRFLGGSPLPTGDLFNHAIGYFPRYQVWVNPTNPYTSFGTLDYGLHGQPALVLGAGGDLHTTPIPSPESSTITLHLSGTASFGGQTTLQARMRSTGLAASLMANILVEEDAPTRQWTELPNPSPGLKTYEASFLFDAGWAWTDSGALQLAHGAADYFGECLQLVGETSRQEEGMLQPGTYIFSCELQPPPGQTWQAAGFAQEWDSPAGKLSIHREVTAQTARQTVTLKIFTVRTSVQALLRLREALMQSLQVYRQPFYLVQSPSR